MTDEPLAARPAPFRPDRVNECEFWFGALLEDIDSLEKVSELIDVARRGGSPAAVRARLYGRLEVSALLVAQTAQRLWGSRPGGNPRQEGGRLVQ